MLIVGPEYIEGRFSQSSASASEFHNVSALGRRNLRSDQANDFVELEGTMHSCHFEGF